jgi:hypothetical protein
MKFIELSTLQGEMVQVSSLPEDARSLITDDNLSVKVIDYPLSNTHNLIISPTLDWDMGDENISRSIINLKTIASVGVFNGPSCDIYEKIDINTISWIYYSIMDEVILLKI